MDTLRFVGPLIRLMRLKRDWSQETLCHGVCAVSYLSKIEQGKVQPNKELTCELFARLGISWDEDPMDQSLRDQLYEGIFSWDTAYTKQQLRLLEDRQTGESVGPYYLDFLVIQAYCHFDPTRIPKEMQPLLDQRQRCLDAILRKEHEEAYRCCPCSLTAFCVAKEAYHKGNYTYALEYLQIAFEQASREGYAHLMMACQSYMANCYADIGNLDAMQRHSLIAVRLGRSVGDEELVETVAYNLAATQLEFGDYEAGYAYFSKQKKHSIMSLHKLAISCEGLGKNQAALEALDKAAQMDAEDDLETAMCDLVRYRLEHPDYLRDASYGQLLMDTFYRIRKERHFGFARFHLHWVSQWLTANRKYREAFELMRDFTNNVN